MSKNIKIVSIIFIVVLVLYYIVYMNQPDPEVFTVVSSPIEMKLKETVNFVEEVSPKTSLIRVQCVCEDTNVAKIGDSRTEVSAISEGTTTLTCHDSSKELAKIEIIVTK